MMGSSNGERTIKAGVSSPSWVFLVCISRKMVENDACHNTHIEALDTQKWPETAPGDSLIVIITIIFFSTMPI